ncbi:MAG TPA: glutathione peroxidase [Jatrophihabitans sp.]|jgi:glutathione peroxidase|uniref:glutathione peroxidase n=1 Tax=Jatrophihabitans sp. TaxID=1932789 RepID=UPI002EEC6AEC
MSISDVRIAPLTTSPTEQGNPDSADAPANLAPRPGVATLVVNVASRCGLTPQYEGLERLQRQYGERGFTVLGVPCNQFAGQEPGSSEQIAEFCSTTYGVSFPLTEKVKVNGADRHPLYTELVGVPDAQGYTGDIRWNFEKFLISPDGQVVARFAPTTTPESDDVVKAIEATLPS